MAATRPRPRPPTVLLTGFEPFDGAAVNASWQAVSSLHGRRIAGHRVVARELPVEFGAALPALRRAIGQVRPGLVLCTGEAGGRAAVSLERVAINLVDARIADNAGAQPVDVPVVAGGPAAYFSTLPLKVMLAALREAGIPAEVSQTAGTFVCNQVFYGLMHALRRRPRLRAGFVHVPCAVMSPDVVADALRRALRAALLARTDIALAAGAES